MPIFNEEFVSLSYIEWRNRLDCKIIDSGNDITEYLCINVIDKYSMYLFHKVTPFMILNLKSNQSYDIEFLAIRSRLNFL